MNFYDLKIKKFKINHIKKLNDKSVKKKKRNNTIQNK